MKRFLRLFPLFLTILTIFSCTDDPNGVGIGLIPPQDNIYISAIFAPTTSSTQYLARVIGNSGQQWVGSWQGIEARAVFQFSGLPLDTNLVIDTAILRFRITYRFKDSSGVFGIEMRQLLKGWSPSTFNWDSTNNSSFISNTIDTTSLKIIAAEDSMMEFRIDPVVRKWIRSGLASPYGVILMPAPTANSSIIIGYYSNYTITTSATPELYLVYHNTSETFHNTFRPFQSVSVANGELPSTSEPVFFVQNAIAKRGLLKFDLSGIPPQASVTQASLQLTLDSTLSLRNKFSNNTLLAHLAVNDSLTSKVSVLNTSATIPTDTNTRVTLDVKALVQQIKTRQEDFGIVLRGSGEFTTLDRFAFYTQAADSSKRPLLKITYTVFPKK